MIFLLRRTCVKNLLLPPILFAGLRLAGCYAGRPSNPETLQFIKLSASHSSIAKDTSEQFTATATYSDGSTEDVTGVVTWLSLNTAVATISPGGFATGVGTGSATIQATYRSVSGQMTLTITSATLVSISVTPANPSIAKGLNQQFTATGTYSDSSTQNLTAFSPVG
jgi:hypothetical protein